MGDSATPPPPPDTSKYSNAQMETSRTLGGLGAEMWQWAQKQEQKIAGPLNEFLGFVMPAVSEQFGWARNMRDYYTDTVRPQIDSLFAEADKYASKAEEQRQRASAIQDVQTAAQAKRAANIRELERYGVDPSMTRKNSMDVRAGVEEAGQAALAANLAGERTKQIGRDLRAQAIDVGTGMLGEAQNAYTTGTNMGVTGINAQIGAQNANLSARQGALPYYGAAMQGVESAAGIVDTSYGRELDYAEAQRAAEPNLAGIGDLVGMGASFIPGLGPAIAPMTGVAKNLTKAQKAADGGPVSAPGGSYDDGGVLRVSDGEYVIPADVVRRLGTNHFDKLIEKETGRPPPSQKSALPVGG